MIQSLVKSDSSDYAKYRSAEIYLEYTRHYHEIDILSGMLNVAIPDVPLDIFRNTFLLHQSRYLNGNGQYSSY